MFSFLFKKSRISTQGFTLLELIVSMTIMTVIITTVALNQNKYSSGTSLRIVADEISLSLRQAQIYGISVRELSSGSNNFSSGYGMTFSTLGGNNGQYIFFADRGSKNFYYDGTWTCTMGGATDECMGKTQIANKNTVSNLCVVRIVGGVDTETCGLGRIDISFVRPKTDAHFVFFDSSLAQVSYSNTKGAKIYLVSPAGQTRSITTYTTGQISVQ